MDKNQTIYLFKNQWEEKSNAMNLFADGSILQNQYLNFTNQLFTETFLQIEQPETVNEVHLFLNPETLKPELQIKDGLINYHETSSGDIHTFNIKRAYSSNDLFNLKIKESFNPSRMLKIVNAPILEKSEIQTQYELIIFEDVTTVVTYPHLIGSEIISNALIHQKNNVIEFEIGKLDLRKYNQLFRIEKVGLKISYFSKNSKTDQTLYLNLKL